MDKIDEFITLVKESNNIVFFGGAGVSTESGIKDFRSADGLYNQKTNTIYSPEEMLSHSFYKNHTSEFFEFYRKNFINLDIKPNVTHYALAKLEKEGKLKGIVTQNIDGLHQLAGSKIVYELHGSVYRNYCEKCHKFHDIHFIKNSLDIPRCECGGIVKPDVVLYGEPLDNDVIEKSIDIISKADLLIIAGTSLAVYPASGFITYFKGKNKVILNKTATNADFNADLIIREPLGKIFQKLI